MRIARGLGEIAGAWWREWISLIPRSLKHSIVSSAGEAAVDSDSIDSASIPEGASKEVVVRLNPGHALYRTLQLPNANTRTLRKVVEFELERISPVHINRIVYDLRIVKRDRRTRLATVQLRLIKRDFLEQISGQCESRGLRIAELRFPKCWGDKRWSGYPVSRFAAARNIARRSATPVLAAMAILLIACNVACQYWRGVVIEHRIAAEIDAERLRAAGIRPVQNRIESARREIAFYTRQRNAPLFVVLLTELSARLPDTTWATRLELSSDKLNIQGLSKSASELPGILDKSPQFTTPQFRTPPMPNTSGESQSFDLLLDLALPL